MKIKTITTILAIFLSATLAGCSIGSKAASQSDNKVEVASVKKQEITGQINLTGVLDAEDSAIVSAQLPGTAVWVGVKEGASVKKGQTLIALDKRDLEVQLEQARANLQRNQEALKQAKIAYENAQKEFERSQELFNAGALSQKQYEQAISQRDLAQSQYEAAKKAGITAAEEGIKAIQLNLAKMEIKSPLSGVVAACNVSEGDNVTAGSSLISIVSIDNLILTGNVSEQLVNYLQPGQKAIVTANIPNGQTFDGEITFISPVSVPTGQFFPVKVKVKNTDHLLRAGMTGSARFTVQLKNVLAVPNAALVKRDGKYCVFVVKDKRAVKVPVKIGLQDEHFTAILEGVSEGDLIVVKGAEALTDGDVVKY